MWKKCIEKFADFRSFCQDKVNLNIWQVNNAIESARTAVTLMRLGFEQLPRNAEPLAHPIDMEGVAGHPRRIEIAPGEEDPQFIPYRTVLKKYGIGERGQAKEHKPIKLARAKTIGKVVAMIFYDLVDEINK